MNSIHSYKDLIVWQRGIELALAVCELTDRFPQNENCELAKSIRMAAIRIPSQIAEGHDQGGKTFLDGLRGARRSCAELATYIAIAKVLPATNQVLYGDVDAALDDETTMLSSLIHSLRSKRR